jgi:hypothetical protein
MTGWGWLVVTLLVGALFFELDAIKDALKQILKEDREVNSFLEDMRASLRSIEDSTEKIPDRPPRW